MYKDLTEEKKREYRQRAWAKLNADPIALARYKAHRKAKWAAFRAEVASDPEKQAKMEQRREYGRQLRERIKSDPVLAKRERELRQKRWAKWHTGMKSDPVKHDKRMGQKQADFLRNKEQRLAKRMEWARNNPDRTAAAFKRFCKAHPDKVLVWSSRSNARRRARLTEASVGVVDYGELVRSANGKCGICSQPLDDGKPLHIDHKVPLAKGGLHTQENLQLAHARCNLKKGAKLLKVG